MKKNNSRPASPETIDLSDPYFTTQLITYIGNKRSLLPFINKGIEAVKTKLRKKKLVTFDGFSGSGAVSRLLKYHSTKLFVNDLEQYCEVINKCYLANRSQIDIDFIIDRMEWLNSQKLKSASKKPGFIEKNYAPKNDNNIKPGERVFYTNRNARIIDNLKKLINTSIDSDKRHFFLAPLIVEASIHTNTSGVFKGFHKKDGLGWFGGQGENALTRIKKEISLETSVFSGVECGVEIFRRDINELVKSKDMPKEIDLAYFDPPYNQHPYGSNYFMLNIIAGDSNEIDIQDGVSGIAQKWNRSSYNKAKQAEAALDDLISNTRAKYILLSYNDEGLIGLEDLKRIMKRHGKCDVMTQEYNTYRGSRNLKGRNIKVKEYLWILEKK
jgi:adenine-specific DNA-methyltransferase